MIAHECQRAVTLAAVILLMKFEASANTGPAVTGLMAPAKNATTAASNPAGLARLERPEWLGQLILFASESTDKTTGDFFPGVRTEDDDGNLYVPFIYYARPLNEKWSFGASFTAPGGFGGDTDSGSIQRYLLDEWTLIYLRLAPAVGYRVNERLSLGGAVGVNYALYQYESAVFNPEPGIGDGKMEIDAGGFSVGFQLSLLYELSPQTRFGINYNSETETEMDDRPSFSGLGPTREMLLEMGGPLSQELEFETVFPQSIGVGLFHQFENGVEFTFDGLWMQFSEFGLTEFKVGETSVELDDQDFEDVWAFSTGLSYPLNSRWTIKGGVAYTSQFIEDENRTTSFRMDRFWGLGAGVEYRWRDNRVIGVNINYFDMGEGPVEDEIPLLGTIRSEYSDNYAIGLDLSFRWLR